MPSSFLTDLSVQTLLRYVDEHLFEPDRKWPLDIFEQRSYERWAAFEMIELIFNNPTKDPKTLIEMFSLEMMSYSHLYDGKKDMFSIAECVAKDILLLL